ncbi:MAG: glycosyltransferase family 4 protein [Bacteroidales bacterium]|nr:glycosyltransferase family 4 protein [Bacteroidales bacterium]
MGKDKPRILFVVPLPPPVHGSTVMCKCIENSELINERFCCDYVNLTTSRKTDEIGVFMVIKIWRVFTAFFNALFKLLTNRYNLCYLAISFHRGFLKDFPFVLLCKMFSRRVVIHLHGKGASEGAKHRYYRWLLNITFRNTKVIMLSWRLYHDVQRFVKKEDVLICPNGVPAVDAVYGKHHNDVISFLFLSNLIESKGVITLLDALKILKERGYTFICKFVGGETKEIDAHRFAEEVANRDLAGWAVYLGRKYGDEKYNTLISSDVFVFPTYNDCFPLVLLEAMQCGLPIVTTDEGAIRDIVKEGENGLICEKRNSQSLADCLSEMITNESLRLAMGAKNYVDYKEKYSIQSFERQLLTILDAFC